MEKSLIIKVRKNHTFENIVKNLVSMGYERTERVDSPGQFFVSGGNISIYSGNYVDPIRLEFFGSEIERIFSYNISDFKKIENLEQIEIKPIILTLEDKSVVKLGDYVVHIDHGIGIFAGFVTRQVENKPENYILIKYLNDDALFVPINLKNKISRYIGIGRKRPRLSRLGSKTWEKTYKKTYENVLRFARELINLYAKREIVKRKPLIINNDWDKEIIKTFGFTETECQKDAIENVISDLKKPVPMDRLICGDVGFGKTEVAIRAAAQVCANGFQVAILVPTTLLCEQHYITLKKRFANLPVRIEHLSRFISRSEQKNIIEDIKGGKVDIVVATHRIFGQDISFKNLGLLVIDEEQKFGVKDKEKLKKLRESLNVLTMTATPIPRTLFMSLSGLRDISQIVTPPLGRKEIETKVEKYDEKSVKEFIDRELNRGGQVYYLHNKVQTIDGVKSKIQKIFKDKIIEVAHGQMSENQLANTMSKFSDGKIDILICSTIIENGLDLPNVNTLIVEDADKFGLSQLYQIRGRIGRSQRQAHALFTFKDKKITDNAFKRLKALVENTEFGTGYNIALSDLEIRGGGNILGKEQHGNMEAIGLVLYSKLLNSTVDKLKK